MTTYGNMRTANEDKINLTGGGQLGGEKPFQDTLVNRTHQAGGAIAKPMGTLKLRTHNLGGELGNGAITDCYGTTPPSLG